MLRVHTFKEIQFMAKKTVIKPTQSELAILRILWDSGSCTVRQVHEVLGGDERAGYTTTLKLMQIMADKGLVVRDESRRSHVYRAAVDERQTLGQVVSELVNRAFGGSAQKLILQALSDGAISKEEIREIRKLLLQRGGANRDDD
jgi:predicted transcriptional regulator